MRNLDAAWLAPLPELNVSSVKKCHAAVRSLSAVSGAPAIAPQTNMKNNTTEISKFLSYVLRHQPQAIDLTLDTEGWADIAALIDGARRAGKVLDDTMIRAVVRDNDKQRFTISEDGTRIRAAQGHTTEAVAISHTAITPPATLFHGTATRFIASIMQEGLKPGQRQHVHLSDNRQTATSVGQRYGVPVVLSVAAGAMHEQGFAFYQADNGVWLTAQVPPAFLTHDKTSDAA